MRRRPDAGLQCSSALLLALGLSAAVAAGTARASEVPPAGAGAEARPEAIAGTVSASAAAVTAEPAATGLNSPAATPSAGIDAGPAAGVGAVESTVLPGLAGPAEGAAQPAAGALTLPAAPPPAAPMPEAAPAPPPPPMPALGFDAGAGVPRGPYGKLIYQMASRYALNPMLVAALVHVESDFNPRARSRKGALGLMQLLPQTARRFGLYRRRDLLNPRKNLEAGGRYLRWLIDRFGQDPIRVLAAYNAGEGAVDRFGGVPPFAETRDYVQRIFARLGFTALLDLPAATLAAAGGTK